MPNTTISMVRTAGIPLSGTATTSTICMMGICIIRMVTTSTNIGSRLARKIRINVRRTTIVAPMPRITFTGPDADTSLYLTAIMSTIWSMATCITHTAIIATTTARLNLPEGIARRRAGCNPACQFCRTSPTVQLSRPALNRSWGNCLPMKTIRVSRVSFAPHGFPISAPKIMCTP